MLIKFLRYFLIFFFFYSRNATRKRKGRTFHPEIASMLRAVRFRVRSPFGFKMERGKAYRSERNGRICHQEQKCDHGSDIS